MTSNAKRAQEILYFLLLRSRGAAAAVPLGWDLIKPLNLALVGRVEMAQCKG